MPRKFYGTVIALIPLPIAIAWAFANFLYLNRFEFLLYDVIAKFYIIYTLVFVLPVAVILFVFPSRRPQIAIIAYVTTAALFMLPGIIEYIGTSVRQRYIIVAVLILAVYSGFILSRLLCGRRYVRDFCVVFLLLTMIPLGQLAVHNLIAPSYSFQADGNLRNKAVRRPNVYFIVLDGYLRADKLLTVLDYDNHSFLQSLDSLGFFVAERSVSNFRGTIVSIGATLRMNYATDYGSRIFKGIFKTTTYQNFRNLGYRLVYLPQVRGYMRCPKDVQCVSSEASDGGNYLGNLDISLLEMLPGLPHILYSLAPGIGSSELNELGALQQYLKKSPTGQPIFLYSHIAMPSSGLRDSDCKKYKYTKHKNPNNTPSKKTYIGYLRCGNPIVQKIVMNIVKQDPEAIVILQADHGIDFSGKASVRDGKRWVKDSLDQYFSILNAWRLPAACKKWLSHDLSAINTFRLVFGCINDTNPNFLPNRSYWIESDWQITLVREGNRWVVPTTD